MCVFQCVYFFSLCVLVCEYFLCVCIFMCVRITSVFFMCVSVCVSVLMCFCVDLCVCLCVCVCARTLLTFPISYQFTIPNLTQTQPQPNLTFPPPPPPHPPMLTYKTADHLYHGAGCDAIRDVLVEFCGELGVTLRLLPKQVELLLFVARREEGGY